MPKRRAQPVEAKLNITSLMDIMTIILVFLLKSYSTEDIQIAPSDDLRLPSSSAQKPPERLEDVTLVLSRRRHDHGSTSAPQAPHARHTGRAGRQPRQQ